MKKIIVISTLVFALFGVKNVFAQQFMGGPAPTLTSCTNGAIDASSSDARGRVAFSGANSTCTVTFTGTWGTNAPICMCQLSGATVTPAAVRCTPTSTALVVVSTVAFANTDAISYLCFGR
jgi:hypothetical protein